MALITHFSTSLRPGKTGGIQNIMRQLCRIRCSRSSLYGFVITIALFTLCNIFGMVSISSNSKDQHISKLNAPEELTPQDGAMQIGNLLSSFVFNFNQSSSRTDSSSTYVIHDSVAVGDAYGNYRDSAFVTLVTQCSVDKLNMLIDMADTWRAPMSIAVFVPGIDLYIAKVYIAYLRLCSQVIRTNATFHFLYHRDMDSAESYAPDHAYDHQTLPSCSRSHEALPLLMRYRKGTFERWWKQALYPQNHLRNVARRGVRTSFHFLTDIDIVPVRRLAEDLDSFLCSSSHAKSCPNCVYIVPTYEMLERLPRPRNKTELLVNIREKQARPFHEIVFILNQYKTNHSLWEKIPDSRTLEAAYKINNYKFFYEPFYIARANVPLHDERFIGYGYTRNTQVYEMHFAGFEMWVLNPAFAVHRGMMNTTRRGAWRYVQNLINSKKFAGFKNEIAIKYRPPDKERS